jgi:murein DD-endopeptidase MepM/ murein hydrolase activator NlpD
MKRAAAQRCPYPWEMRWLLLSILLPLLNAQTFAVKPARIRQGETLRLTADGSAEAARLGKRKVPLYADGQSKTGLMPIGIGAKPGTYTVEFLDSQNSVLDKTTFIVIDAHYPKQNVVLPKAIAGLKSSPEERENVNAFRAEESPERLWQEPLHPPIPGCMTSLFGVERYINGKPTGDYHAGIDQRGAAGTHIHAVADGIVRLAAQYELRGGTVAVDHGQGMTSIYLHMSKVLAKPGDRVTTTDTLGLVGSTGRSTAPHLHWTLYVHGEPVNPNQWIRNVPCATRPVSAARQPAKHS